MLTSRRAVATVPLLVSLLCGTASAAGQNPAQPPTGPPPLKLQLEKTPEVTSGSVAVAEGLATATPNRMWLEGLGISQPISVTVASTNPAEPLTVSLTKDSWDDALHTTTTNGEGTVTVNIRTQGEMGVKVTSASGHEVPFLLSVWVGDEVTPEMPDILTPVTDYSQAGGGWMKYATWGGIGLGGVGVVGLIFWLGRRSSRKSAAVVIALLVGWPAIGPTAHARGQQGQGTAQTLPGAQGPGGAQTLPGVQGTGGARTLPGAQGPGGAQTLPGVQGPGGASTLPGAPGLGGAATLPGNTPGGLPGGGGAAAQQVGAGGFFRDLNAPTGGSNAGQQRAISPGELRQMQEDARLNQQIDANRRFAQENARNVQQMQPGRDIPTQEQAQQMMRDAVNFNRNANIGAAADARTAAAIRSGVNASAAQFQSALGGAIGAAARLLQGYAILHSSDGGCVPNTSPAGMPTVPSMCAGSAECRACYAQAYGKLNQLRFTFEKLRCIYQNTKSIGTKSISFGDTVSPIHGVSGLAWQVERRKIEESLKTLNQSYDAKYSELLGKLGQSMQEINMCEARYFGNPDWYARYGFMYQTFMGDRYKRQ